MFFSQCVCAGAARAAAAHATSAPAHPQPEERNVAADAHAGVVMLVLFIQCAFLF